MDDPYGLAASGLDPELAAELLGVRRRQAIADLMAQRGMAPVQNIGGQGATLSPFQGLAQMAQAWVGRRESEGADQKYADIASRQRARMADAMAEYERMKMGSPGIPAPPDELGGGPAKPAVAGDRRGALVKAMSDFYLQKNPVVKADLATMQKEGEPYNLRPDEERRVGDRVVARGAPSAPKPKAFAPGETRTVQVGGDSVTQEYQPDGSWKEIGRGAKWNPKGESERPFFTFIGTPGGIVTGNARTGELSMPTLGGAPAMRTTDDPNAQAAIAGAKETGQQTGRVNVEQHQAAISATDNIAKLDQMLDQMKNSQAITGLGAELLKNIERAKVFVSQSEAAGKKVSDTELLDTMLGSEVFPQIQALGIGARGMDTPAERDFIRGVITGRIDMNRNTLIQMAEMRRRIAQRAIDRWNERVDRGELDAYFQSSGRTKEKLGMKRRASDQPSQADLEFTAKKHGITVDEVKRRMGIR